MRIIFVGSEIQRYAGILIGIGVSAESLEAINQAMLKALFETRKHALGLVEAFEIKDEALISILGRKDGDVYRHMLDNAKNVNPLNKTKMLPGIRELLRPKI